VTKHYFRKLIAVLAMAFATAGLSLTAAAGANAATTAPRAAHPNATTVCGDFCFNLWNGYLGPNMLQNAYQGAGLGHVIQMRNGSNAYVDEDFEFSFTGIVGNAFTPGSACAAGLLPHSSKLCLDGTYFADPVWQAVFSPDSNSTNQCIGVARAFDGARVQLVSCQDKGTLWVSDTDNPGDNGNTPYINGADSGFANPLVLNLNGSSHSPKLQLDLSNENPSAGVVNDHKQFGVYIGPFVFDF
jgi:hypothetical protein